MANMPTQNNRYNVTEDQAVDIGKEAFTKHLDVVAPAYGPDITRAYLGGCLAVITHYLIEKHGGEVAFEILTAMADMTLTSGLAKGK